MVPALLQLFGAPELRFFLLLYLLLYAYVFIRLDYVMLKGIIKERWIYVVPLTCLVVLLWIALFGMIIADYEQGVFLIND